MGAVFRAEDRDLGRIVAIKVLTLEPGPEVLTRMKREARLMSLIRHPGVVELYDFGILEGLPYLVMEYLDGHDLSRLDSGKDPLPPLLEVAGALDEVHRRGVLHRDVKPENILLAASGRTVLTDFGLAYDPAADPVTRTGVVVGTVAYMSPEVFSGLSNDEGADWWAWGVTLFCMCERKLPFSYDVAIRMGRGRDAIPEVEFKALRDPDRQRLIRRCLNPDPECRPRSLAHIEAVLAESQANFSPPQLISAPLSTLASVRISSLQPQKSSLSLGLFALLISLFLGGFAGLYLWQRRSASEEATALVERSLASPSKPPPLALGASYPERLRLELDELGWSYQSPEGREEVFRGRSPPGDWQEVLSADPAAWGPLTKRLSGLRLFRQWLLDGGKGEELRTDLVADLKEVDELFRGQGLPRPFFPFLYLKAASDPVVVPGTWREELFDGKELPGIISGWKGTAIVHLQRASRRYQSMTQVVQRAGMGEGEIPADFPGENMGGLAFLAFRNPLIFPQELWHQETARRVSGPWSRELGEEVHAFLYAASRGLAEGSPQDTYPWVRLMTSVLGDMNWWVYSYLARLDPIWLFGREPKTAAEWWLGMIVWERQVLVAKEFSWPQDQEEALTLFREASQRSIRGGQKEGASADFLARVARSAVYQEYRLGQSTALLKRFRAYRKFLLYEGWSEGLKSIVPVLLWAGRFRDGEADQLTDSEIRSILDWYQAHPQGLQRTFSGQPVANLVEWARERLQTRAPE
jgi:serine/threonine protein kinase